MPPSTEPSSSPDAPTADGVPGAGAVERGVAPPWRRWLPRAVVEGALIAFSVVLGLAASAWRDGRAARERAGQALAAITAELDSNRVLVRRARLHHRAIADSIARYQARGEPLPERIYFGAMFNPARVLDDAWQSARDGGALERLPYPVVLRLSEVYARQAQYHELYEAIVQRLYGDMMSRGTLATFRDNAPSWHILLRDFADREGTMEEAYGGTLAEVRRTRVR
jgi:hypothetical protein